MPESSQNKSRSVPPRVCVMTSAHPAFDSRIYYKQCCSLAAAGYRVTLVVPKKSPDKTEERTTHSTRLQAGSVPVEIDFVELQSPSGRFERFTRTLWQIYSEASRQRADVYHFHDPDLIPVGMLLSLRGKRVIYDVHEDVPGDIIHKAWIPAWIRAPVAQAMRALEWLAARVFFTATVAATPDIASRFPEAKTVLVRNFPMLSEFRTVPAPYLSRPPIVTYVGYITQLRGIKENIEALEHTNTSVRLQLAGEFESADLERRARNYSGWLSVDFLGWLDRSEVATLMANSRAGLVLLHPTPPYKLAYPVKMFEYMLAGIPVIASDFPLWRKVVDSAGCGILTDPLDPRAIAQAIDWIISHPADAAEMGARGREAALQHYNWDTERDTLLSLYQRVVQ